jgi:hexosaminidase
MVGMGNTPTTAMRNLIPAPTAAEPDATTFTLVDTAVVTAASPDSVDVAEYLAALLRPATGYALPVRAEGSGIALELTGPAGPRGEAYTLDIGPTGVTLRAGTAEGLFRGVQTLRQLFGPRINRGTVQSGPWTLPGGRITDQPRFAYRGVMLDVTRHFFGVADVKRFIDLAASLKLNYLHLHLTDDQGWRLAIDAWPLLTTYGGATEVGDGPGGYYTKDDYREIVAYAASRFLTVVPEVDLPGHTNAALASYPELNGDGRAPERYTGIEVGFSALSASNELTYRFLDEVFGEIAAMTPGEYLHIGGDEALAMTHDDYAAIVERAQEIVNAHGKTVVAWHEAAAAKLMPSTVVQYWGITTESPELVAAGAQGNKIIMSPANHAYLDMKYDADSPLGLSWAGFVSVEDSYEWDPVTAVAGLDPTAILGVEGPLWTETTLTIGDIEFLAFPRIASLAELGWASGPRQDWAAFRSRLAEMGAHWDAWDVNFHRSAEIPW